MPTSIDFFEYRNVCIHWLPFQAFVLTLGRSLPEAPPRAIPGHDATPCLTIHPSRPPLPSGPLPPCKPPTTQRALAWTSQQQPSTGTGWLLWPASTTKYQTLIPSPPRFQAFSNPSSLPLPLHLLPRLLHHTQPNSLSTLHSSDTTLNSPSRIQSPHHRQRRLFLLNSSPAPTIPSRRTRTAVPRRQRLRSSTSASSAQHPLPASWFRRLRRTAVRPRFSTSSLCKRKLFLRTGVFFFRPKNPATTSLGLLYNPLDCLPTARRLRLQRLTSRPFVAPSQSSSCHHTTAWVCAVNWSASIATRSLDGIA